MGARGTAYSRARLGGSRWIFHDWNSREERHPYGMRLCCRWELGVGGLPGLDPRRFWPAFGTGHELVHRCSVDGLSHDVGVTGVTGDLLDDVEQDPSNRPG